MTRSHQGIDHVDHAVGDAQDDWTEGGVPWDDYRYWQAYIAEIDRLQAIRDEIDGKES